jgi:hypothetical protein
MIKWLVLVLLVLNVLWAAWARDAFAPWGWAPVHTNEPERFEQQLRPDALEPARSQP